MDDERMEILERLERGDITAAEAEDLLEALSSRPYLEDDGPAPSAGPEPETSPAERGESRRWSPSGPIRELRVVNAAGTVTARAGVETWVSVTPRGGGRAFGIAENLNVKFDEEDGVATVRAEHAGGVFRFLGLPAFTADFEISVPADVLLKLELGNGSFFTEGVRAVEFDVGNGRGETDARVVRGDFGNGRLRCAGTEELVVDAGNAVLSAERADALARMAVNFGNGKVTVAGAALPAGAAYELDFGNGKAAFEWARAPENCEIVVKTVLGKTEGDLTFTKAAGGMRYAVGEPAARVVIDGKVVKAVFKIKEER